MQIARFFPVQSQLKNATQDKREEEVCVNQSSFRYSGTTINPAAFALPCVINVNLKKETK
jgi:hypothetical protein